MTKNTNEANENDKTTEKPVASKSSAKKVTKTVTKTVTKAADKVGVLLANERKKRNLEIAEVADRLRIRKLYIEAIEKGNYAELPELPYSAGFVGSYAKFLNMNEVRITQLFKDELKIIPTEPRGFFMVEELAPKASVPSKRYIVASVLFVILLMIIWSGFYGSDNNLEEPQNNMVEKVAKPNVKYFEPKIEEAESVEEVKSVQVVEDSYEFEDDSQVVMKEGSFYEEDLGLSLPSEVEIKIGNQDTWIEVRDANKVYVNKVLPAGQSYKIAGKKGLILSVGKEDAEVYFDGRLTQVVTPKKKTNISLDKYFMNNN